MKSISFSPPDITEEEIAAVTEALRSGWITTGPRTVEFERQIAAYCGAARAVCLNSATAALELSLRALGIGPGDEVITSAYTYTASASVICHVGAVPVLVDTPPDSFHMTADCFAAAVTPRTKAVIPVDIAGVMCGYDEIIDAADAEKACFSPNNQLAESIGRIAVVADCAHSFGAVRKERRAGSSADFNCFSFHAVKNLTTAEGGAITFSNTNSKNCDELYRWFRAMSLHGQTKDAHAKLQPGAWEYDIIEPAFKCNMTDVAAAMGLVQLARYPSLLARRREIIGMYDRAFAGSAVVPLAHMGEDFCSSGHLYLTRIAGADETARNRVIRQLAEQGIAANVHYKPLPMLSAYQKLGFAIKDFPNAYHLYENELTLPLHTLLSDDDISYIIDIYKRIV